MATMATEQGAGGLTPPSTAAPSTHASRQVSREASASMTNNPYDGNTTKNTNNASGRDARANSLAEPLPQHNNTTGQRRDVLGGGVAAAAQAAAGVAIEYGGGEDEHQHAIAMVSTAKHKWTFSTGRVLVLW